MGEAMKIQEAIKSGKPFKRPEFIWWVHAQGSLLNMFNEVREDFIRFYATTQDILADDWEVKP